MLVDSQSNEGSRILFRRFAPLAPKWEIALLEAADRSEIPISMKWINEDSLSEPGITAIVLLYGAAHHKEAVIEAVSQAAKCRENNPDARLLMAACDHAGQRVSKQAMFRAAKEVGLNDPLDAEVFSGTDEYRNWLTEHFTLIEMSAGRATRDILGPVSRTGSIEGLDSEETGWTGLVL
ncbi:hypothetical protein [Actinomadura coerulea]|uniref:hypothetical protein n=1 Tax=Actinomadura coerulea TaxID=46159 RepID=UPI003448E1E6